MIVPDIFGKKRMSLTVGLAIPRDDRRAVQFVCYIQVLVAADLDREGDDFELPPLTANMLHGSIASFDCRVPVESILPKLSTPHSHDSLETPPNMYQYKQ